MAEGIALPAEAVLGVTHSITGRRWIWRGADERLGLAIAQRLARLIGSDGPSIIIRTGKSVACLGEMHALILPLQLSG